MKLKISRLSRESNVISSSLTGEESSRKGQNGAKGEGIDRLLAVKMEEPTPQRIQTASEKWKRQGNWFFLRNPEGIQPGQSLDASQ